MGKGINRAEGRCLAVFDVDLEVVRPVLRQGVGACLVKDIGVLDL